MIDHHKNVTALIILGALYDDQIQVCQPVLNGKSKLIFNNSKNHFRNIRMFAEQNYNALQREAIDEQTVMFREFIFEILNTDTNKRSEALALLKAYNNNEVKLTP